MFYSLFRLGLLNHCRNGLFFFLIFFLLKKSLFSAYVCGCDVVKGGPVGVIEFDMMNCCREVFVVVPWGNGPGIDV